MLKVKVFIYNTVYFKNSLYEFGSAWFVQMLHYFGFTIQLIYAMCFNVKVKNLAFDTSKMHGFLWRTTLYTRAKQTSWEGIPQWQWINCLHMYIHINYRWEMNYRTIRVLWTHKRYFLTTKIFLGSSFTCHKQV